MSEIKMSDVFNYPEMVSGRDMDTRELQDRQGGLYAVFYNTQACISTIIAINAYDANQQEIAELKAQVSLIKRHADSLMDSKSGIDYSGKMDGLLDAIDKAPQQCLASVKAETIRDFNLWCLGHHKMSMNADGFLEQLKEQK